MKKKLLLMLSLCTLCGCANGQHEAPGDSGAPITEISSSTDVLLESTEETEETEEKRVTIEINPEEVDISGIEFYTAKAYVKEIDCDGISMEITGNLAGDASDITVNSAGFRVFGNGQILDMDKIMSTLKIRKAYRDGIIGDRQNTELYKEKIDFEFGTSEECIDKLREIFSKYGIYTDEFVIDTYFASGDKMKANESYLDMESDEILYENRYEWSRDDDMYAFYFGQEYCGLPVYATFGERLADVNECRVPMCVWYNKDGIVYLLLCNIVEFDSGGEKVELMDFKELVGKVAKKYEMLLDDCRYNIKDAKLVCDVDAKNMTRPVWVFAIEIFYKLEDGTEFCHPSLVRYDAGTGKEIINVSDGE